MDENEEDGFWATIWRESLVAMSLGWELAVPIFGGVLLGHLLDDWLETRHIFTLGLLVLGIAIAYYNLARFIHQDTRKDRGNDERMEDANE